MRKPTADVSVRVAWPDDAGVIGALQVRSWRREYAELLPADVLAGLDPEAFGERWRESLTRPKDARNRVLVALERASVRGFAVTGPSGDPDSDPLAVGEIVELVVDPDAGRQGHGSRLLQACVDTLYADRFSTAITWLSSTDDVRRGFLSEAGWAPDGAHRELDLYGDGSTLVRQVRLHTDIGADGGPEERSAAHE
jgi:GNAT superfamily N-acetyltransferase